MRRRPPDRGRTKTTSASISEAGADVVCVQSLSQEIEQADCNPRARISESASTTSSDEVNAIAHVHPALRQMREVADRMFERCEFERAFNVFHVVAVLNAKPAFWQPAAHLHFHTDKRVSDA